MSFGFDARFEEPFYGGGSSTSLASNRAYPVSLDGIPYMLDTKEERLKHSSVPLLRASFDDKENTGRATLNPEAFWRRTFESWHVGAGQSHFDRVDESNPWRFRRSRGIAVLDNKYRIELLPDTDSKLASTNTNLRLAVAGGFLYLTDGTALKHTTDITPDTPTFTTVTGGTATAFTSIASDGFNVLLAAGTSGIDKTTRGSSTKTNHITGTVAEVTYGKGRWLAANANSLYDITTLVAGGGALPSALFSHSNTDFVWNSFAEGPTALYAGGFSGDKSLIYRLTIKEDGTGLNQPVVAGFLPDGEIIRSMQGYLGFVVIGTSRGVRVGVVGGNGDLTIGSFIPTTTDVLCFEGQEKFVWFGWTNFESSNFTGLGRLDMETFSNIDSLAPAFASDLMITDDIPNAVQSVATFQGLRVFTVSGSGVWAEHATRLAATGELDSGVFDYGLTDKKVSLWVDSTRTSAPGGSYSFAISLDGGAFTNIGIPVSGVPLPTGEARAQEFELRILLTRDSVNTTLGPTIKSFDMRSEVAPSLVEIIDVPLLIAPKLHRLDKVVESVDSVAQVDNIRSLRNSKDIVQYTEAGRAWSVVVVDYELDEHDLFIGPDEALGINGRCLVRLKVVV